MRRSMSTILLFSLLLVVQGCCCLDEDAFASKYLMVCCNHLEAPFTIPAGGPGVGLVFGTADFNGAGTVLIKLQVEDLSAVSGNQAEVTAWSGNGAHPAAAPTGDDPFYETNGDALLRLTTTHINRDYEPVDDKYWIWVRVVHRLANGTQAAPMDLWYEWTPSGSSVPDPVHEFN